MSSTALAGTALLMGLAGGPHCVAMCGAACAGVIRVVRAPPGGGVASLALPARTLPAEVLFHAGRVAGYAAAGAVAAATMQALALASEQVAALRPLWLLLHVVVLAWGLVLAATGRQPLWAGRLGRWATARLQPVARLPFGAAAAGALWVGMPCGLLYSALMLAALGNGVLGGAAVMALFAAGSALSLLLAPWLWHRLRAGGGMLSQAWGTRLAGVLLAAVALQAVGTDLARQIGIWCR
ncbi:sulfite exporter TauE/SafE family protein [Variovorax sp. J22P168]|uniref:sulfite exporter TauE/SafE family protein n=1 Tax=Variovorax jilinensis TaxID=3053513 RepID=UPI0025789E88|nr:sulfite exporter TauE/SafE family protein [Variovorax sp. J22P168]MDM0014289.1 sulfite exporter TauE/SafE family protein [Variovorax sp. J22P168]